MLKPNILITGVSGFVGSHLLHRLKADGFDQIWGLTRQKPGSDPRYEGVQLLQGDLRDQDRLKVLFQIAKPDWIFHLAGQALVSASWEDPRGTFGANADAQISLFEALRTLKLNPRILVVGSSEEYGFVKEDELPVKETNPLRPLSPYAVSKVAQDLLAFQYFRSYGLRTIRVRAFNHTGPGRPKQYAISNFAYQVAQIERGAAPPILRVGNLDVRRDYLDVRDMVQAYVLAIQKGEDGEVYNLSSGRAQNLRDILVTLLSLSKSKIEVKVDPARFRPSDLPIIYGSSAKFERLTGWRPQIAMKTTLTDLLQYWRHQEPAHTLKTQTR
jgi:GDP-4-dehydro-6-deoxy-D-mannose reductase